jgi:hypothetical protein
MVTNLDGMTYSEATRAARRHGWRLYSLCADAKHYVSTPPLQGGITYAYVALASDHVVLARVGTPHTYGN